MTPWSGRLMLSAPPALPLAGPGSIRKAPGRAGRQAVCRCDRFQHSTYANAMKKVQLELRWQKINQWKIDQGNTGPRRVSIQPGASILGARICTNGKTCQGTTGLGRLE